MQKLGYTGKISNALTTISARAATQPANMITANTFKVVLCRLRPAASKIVAGITKLATAVIKANIERILAQRFYARSV